MPVKPFVIAVLALVAAVPVPAATSRGETLRATVCVRETLWTKPIPRGMDAVPRVYVNGVELRDGTAVNARYVWWAGRGVLATLRMKSAASPMRLRVVNANDSCVKIRFLYRLEARAG